MEKTSEFIKKLKTTAAKTKLSNNFRNKYQRLLTKRGYSFIYAINHPTNTNDEVHYIKNGIRVICILKDKAQYLKLNTHNFVISIDYIKYFSIQDLNKELKKFEKEIEFLKTRGI